MASNRFSSVREEMEKEISSRNENQSTGAETLDSYMNQRVQSYKEKRNNGSARESYTAQMDSRRYANDWLNRYNKLLDDVDENGFSQDNVEKFDSLRREYDSVSEEFTQDARKKLSDYFKGFTGILSSIQYPEQIDYLRVKLHNSYQDTLDEAIEANPGVSLHNLPYTDDMKFVRSEMDALDEFEESFNQKKYPGMDSSLPEDTVSAPDNMESRRAELQKSYQESLDEAIEANPGVSLHNIPVTDDMKYIKSQMDELDKVQESADYNRSRSGKFEYDPKYDSSIPFRGRGGTENAVPKQKSFSDIQSNRYFQEKAESGTEKFNPVYEKYKEEKDIVDRYVSRPTFLTNPAANFLLGAAKKVVGSAADLDYMLPSENWTQEEKDVFAILYDSDIEKAQKFAIDVNNFYNQKNQELEKKEIEKFADAHPVAATAWGVGTDILGLGMEDISQAVIDKAVKGTIPTNEDISPFQAARAATGRVSENLNERFGTIEEDVPVFGGKGLGDAYQLLLSVVESAATANTLGTAGTDIVFFSNAAASALYDAKSRDASDDQAITFAMIEGAAEALGEHFSASHLLEMTNAGTIKAFFGSMFGQAFEEGEEELFTSIVNNLADNYIMRDKSNFHIYVNKYMEANPNATKEEAEKEAWKNMWSDMAFDFVGGFASGGIHTGMQAGVNKVRSDIYYKNTYGDYSSELVQEGLESPEGTKSRTLAEKYQQKLDAGKGLSGRDLRRLVNANEEQFAIEDTETGSEVETETEGNVVDSEIETTTEVTESGFTVKNADGYTEIRFKDSPSQEMEDALEENGFKYRDSNNTWYGDMSEEDVRNLISEIGVGQQAEQGNESKEEAEPSNENEDVLQNEAVKPEETAPADKGTPEDSKEYAETGFTVGTDSEHGTTVISFEEVPPKEVQAALKENGFKFSNKNKVWYGNATTEKAREIVRAAMEPAVEQETSSKSDGKTVNRAHDVSVEAVAEIDKSNLDLQEAGEEPGTVEEEHPVTTSLSFGRNSEKKSTASAEADRPFEISKTTGKTFVNLEDGSTVETRITGIASSEKGNLMLNVAGEDSPVRASDISYPDSGEESLYQD